MSGDKLEIKVTFEERGYIGSAPELRQAVVALSLGGLRRKIEIATASPSGNGTGGRRRRSNRNCTA